MSSLCRQHGQNSSGHEWSWALIPTGSCEPQEMRSHLYHLDLCVSLSVFVGSSLIGQIPSDRWRARLTQLHTHTYTHTDIYTHTAGYLHMVSVFLCHMMKYWRNRGGRTVWVRVCVKLYCLFHNQRDEIRGQVSDSTMACHKNAHTHALRTVN